MKHFFAVFKIRRVFKDFTCPAYTGRLKGENIRIIMERNGLSEAVYVEIHREMRIRVRKQKYR